MLTYFRNPNWQGGRKMITVEDSRRSVEKMVEFYNTFSEEKLVVIRGRKLRPLKHLYDGHINALW